jgi:hypothetical protein
MKQKANTIVMEMEGTKSEDVRDLHYGRGKIMRRVSQLLGTLEKEGQTPVLPEDAPDAPEAVKPVPVIIVVRLKRHRKGLLDYAPFGLAPFPAPFLPAPCPLPLKPYPLPFKP